MHTHFDAPLFWVIMLTAFCSPVKQFETGNKSGNMMDFRMWIVELSCFFFLFFLFCLFCQLHEWNMKWIRVVHFPSTSATGYPSLFKQSVLDIESHSYAGNAFEILQVFFSVRYGKPNLSSSPARQFRATLEKHLSVLNKMWCTEFRMR